MQLLLREFQSVFCEARDPSIRRDQASVGSPCLPQAFETCESPRVRLLDVEEIENPKKHSQVRTQLVRPDRCECNVSRISSDGKYTLHCIPPFISGNALRQGKNINSGDSSSSDHKRPPTPVVAFEGGHHCIIVFGNMHYCVYLEILSTELFWNEHCCMSQFLCAP